MGGANVTWRLVRQVVLLITVAAMGVLVVAPAMASSDEADPPVAYRVALAPHGASGSGAEQAFVATVTASDDGVRWRPAAGEAVTFAYVSDGAGAVTSVDGGPVGSMTCATDATGHCTLTVRTDAPGEAVVLASARGQHASVLLP